MLRSAQRTAQFSRRLANLAVAATVALMAGCAALGPATAPSPASGDLTAEALATPSDGNCRRWYGALDEAIEHGNVRDAGAVRIAGFPQLRVDRFAASFRDSLAPRAADGNARAQLTALLDYLRELDTEARLFEMANLPGASRAALKLPPDTQLRRLLDACSSEVTSETLARVDSVAALANKLAVPDHYADWKRALGLYPLTSIPFLHGVNVWQQEIAGRFAHAPAHAEPTTRYLPSIINSTLDDTAVQRFAAGPRNALGIPQLAASDWSALLAQYAPVFDIETPKGAGANARSHTDHFGALRFTTNDTPGIDIDNPVAYQRIAFTRYRGQTLTQLVYSIWFPERPASQMIDLLAGHLDGVMIRITLDERGIPLLVDSIHSCGCYHLFFPTPRLSPRPAPQSHMEWAFIPATLPLLGAGQRVQLRLASASHYLVDIRPFDNVLRAADIRYGLRDDNELRSLPIMNAGHKSVFGNDGIIDGSERGERFLFWPMGIASPGAMRQWGTHATAFVGRRHFDYADLIEQRFEFKPE